MEEEGDGAAGASGTAPPPPRPPAAAAAAAAAELLGRRLRVQVADGRVLLGDFACLDKQGNIILHQTAEEILVDGAVQEKPLGQVLVPARLRAKCELVATEEERAELERRFAAAAAPAAAGG